MTTPSSGTMSLSQVATELGQPNAGFSMERPDVRALGQVSATPGSPYSMSALYNRTCITKQVTIGNEAASYGYNEDWVPPQGSVAPDRIFRGRSITGLWINGSSATFRLDGALLPTSYLYAIMFRAPGVAVSGSTPLIILKASDASFLPNNSWLWVSGAGGSGWSGATGQVAAVQLVY